MTEIRCLEYACKYNDRLRCTKKVIYIEGGRCKDREISRKKILKFERTKFTITEK